MDYLQFCKKDKVLLKYHELDDFISDAFSRFGARETIMVLLQLPNRLLREGMVKIFDYYVYPFLSLKDLQSRDQLCAAAVQDILAIIPEHDIYAGLLYDSDEIIEQIKNEFGISGNIEVFIGALSVKDIISLLFQNKHRTVTRPELLDEINSLSLSRQSELLIDGLLRTMSSTQEQDEWIEYHWEQSLLHDNYPYITDELKKVAFDRVLDVASPIIKKHNPNWWMMFG